MIGKILTHYKILEKLGAGGMGEVYRAEDLRLHRQVAVKVLPDIFAADHERLARFEREAKLLAALSHANIAAIYGLEEVEGKSFLVLELVEGETLAQRIKRGRLPADEALDVCRQVAEGLAAAHEKNIVHRDLKPANIKLTPEGKVKVLDFGLARAFLDKSPVEGVVDSPTITAEMTQPGVILGTAAYMSPEQAKGKPVDRRVDIWAFGCILFECLTGRAAFPGETITEVLAAVLKGDPDWEALPKNLSVNVRAVLRRCLQKDRNLRFHDIADARIELFEAPSAFPSAPSPALRRRSYLWVVPGALAMIITGILIGLWLMRNFRPAASPSVVTATIKVESGHWLDGMRLEGRPSRTSFAISSDGKFIVYSAIDENPNSQALSRLFLRRLDQSQAVPIAGTDGGINPFLSPDNHWVGFWADGKLKKVSVEGGAATELCDVAFNMRATWGRENSLVFDNSTASGLSRVSAEGGKPEILTKLDPKREESSHRLPFWLPNSNAILFTVMRHSFDSQPKIALLRIDTGERDILLQDGADARYVPSGHLVFMRQGTLMAVRFDLALLEVIGQPIVILKNVMQGFSTNSDYHTGAGQFCVSDVGTLVYTTGGVPPEQQNILAWVDQRGVEQPVTDLRLPFSSPRLSPDGHRIAYKNRGSDGQIWVYDLTRNTNSRLTNEGRTFVPIWSPDGLRVLFASQKDVTGNLFWQPFDGSSPMERLTTSEYEQVPGSWSPDGKTVAFAEWHEVSGWDIAMLDTLSGRTAILLNSQFSEKYPEISPDGQWIAYTTAETKRSEVYVRPFRSPGSKYQISSKGGTEPLWGRNIKQLFFRWEDEVWAAEVRIDNGFSVGKPRLLFSRAGYLTGTPARAYDLSLDSQRFLMVKLEERKPQPVTEIVFVQNWFEELKRLLPAKK